jgi:formyl-CoA transferase
VAAYFLAANRGKKSACIDFARSEGAALVRKMAAQCDVLVENFKVGGLAKFGLDAATLRAANPRLVYASITGFGQDGPYADRAGYDYIIQGMGGLMSVTGLPDGEPGGGPMRVGVAVVDLFTGLYASNAILAALNLRHATGEGATIDLSLFETQLDMLANQASNALVSGSDPPRQGNTHPNIVPYQPFNAADQPIIIAVGNDRQFARLAEMCGEPEWASDPRFATNGARVAHRAELVPLIAANIAERTAADWLERLEAAGIPAGPINRIGQALSDPQARHRQAIRRFGSGALGEVPTVGSPLRFDHARAEADLPPPALGEHTDEVLAEFGLDADEIARLRASGVVV